MNKTIYFASKQCPIGCGEVMFLQGKTNEALFCYCTGCGVAFANPKDSQPDSTTFNIKLGLESFSPDAIKLPTIESIEAAGLENWVADSSTEIEWYTEDEINANHYART